MIRSGNSNAYFVLGSSDLQLILPDVPLFMLALPAVNYFQYRKFIPFLISFVFWRVYRFGRRVGGVLRTTVAYAFNRGWTGLFSNEPARVPQPIRTPLQDVERDPVRKGWCHCLKPFHWYDYYFVTITGLSLRFFLLGHGSQKIWEHFSKAADLSLYLSGWSSDQDESRAEIRLYQTLAIEMICKALPGPLIRDVG